MFISRILNHLRLWLQRSLLHLQCGHATVHCKTVMLVQLDFIGDFLVTLPLFRAVYEHFHPMGYRVVMVCSSRTDSIAKGCPFFDDVISFDFQEYNESGKARRSLYRQVMEQRAEYAIRTNLMPIETCVDDWLVYFSGAKYRCGIRRLSMIFPGNRSSSECRKRLMMWEGVYNVLPEGRDDEDFYANCQRLLKAVDNGTEWKLELTKPDWCRQTIDKPKTPYYIVAPTASGIEKSWPPERFAAIIDRIFLQRPELAVVVTGVGKDRPVVDEMLKHVRSGACVIDLCGKSSVGQLFDLAEEASFIVCNDSGMGHIGAVCGAKCFVMMGRWPGYSFYPNSLYRSVVTVRGECGRMDCQWRCPRQIEGRFQCVAGVSVECAWKAISEWFEECKQ